MIEKTIKEIVSTHVPSEGDNLLGMEIDLTHYFEKIKTMELVSIERTDDPACMFLIRLRVTRHAERIGELNMALNRAWQSVSYTHFQASSITTCKESSEIRFVTIIAEDSFYVSGKAIVEGKGYQRLSELYEKGFKPLPSKKYA